MAVGNEDTTQDNNVEQQTAMTVYGTNEAYVGLTVLIGGYLYTTVGGALEGNSLQLIPLTQDETNSPDENNQLMNQNQENNNPVVELFQAPATPRYRRSDNNLLVPIGTPLHRHADDTIMTEHSMGPNDNSVVVFQILGDEIGEQPQPASQTEGVMPDIVPPLPDGTCPVGYNLVDGNCIHHTGMMGFGANTSLGGGGNGNTNQGGGGNYGN